MGQEAGAGCRAESVWACGWEVSGKDGACVFQLSDYLYNEKGDFWYQNIPFTLLFEEVFCHLVQTSAQLSSNHPHQCMGCFCLTEIKHFPPIKLFIFPYREVRRCMEFKYDQQSVSAWFEVFCFRISHNPQISL